jgi:tetratricopeptide (TPR) repeat protein
MKRTNLLVLAISAGLVMLATNPVFSAEKEKKKSHLERLLDDGESYDVDGKKIGKQAEVEKKYPEATRVEPEQKGASAVVKLRNQMITAFQKDKLDEATASAEKLKQDEKANDNDRAVATRVLALCVAKKDINNHAASIPLLEEMLQLNALDNNAHYGAMSELAQRYLLNQDYEDALTLSDKFLAETKTQKKEILAVRGNSLYRLKRLPEAIVALEKIHAADPADVSSTQMLAKAYADSNQPTKAAELMKGVVQLTGKDRVSQVNLAITYFDSKQYEMAADVIAELRATNQLVEERDFQTARNVYTAMKNRENDVVAVMELGFEKGVLQGTSGNYNGLAEAYYYSSLDNNIAKAIANWKKAAPLAKDGTIYLNLAIVQCQEQLWAGCKESAKSAIAKGGINANEAKTQIANADKELGQSK